MGILTSQDQRYLSDGYIVPDNGRYLGLGTGDQLVRAVTETRIEAARQAVIQQLGSDLGARLRG